jgi:hypothetical protein
VTDQEIMRAAFAALLRGDTAERDRLIAPLLAREKMRQTAHVMVDRSKAIEVKQPDGSALTFKTIPRGNA